MKLAISIIAIRKYDDELEFLIQKRMNTGTPDWYGLWEFPQGKLSDSSILDLAKFKFHHETNMILKHILITPNHWVDCCLNPTLNTYSPFIVVHAGKEYAMHFFGIGEGKFADTEHATNHTWVKTSELRKLLHDAPDSVCPLNKPAFEALVQTDLSLLAVQMQHLRHPECLENI